MANLILEQISVKHADRNLLEQVSLSIAPGQIVAVMGANGAGKSTLLRAIAGLVPSSGKVSFAGEALLDLPPHLRAQRVGYLPQQHDFAWPMSVRDMVALGRFAFGEATTPSPDDIDALLTQLGIIDLADQPADQLSGGEQALAALARVLLAATPVLLLDEPAASLDIGRQYQLLDIIAGLTKAGRTILIVLHDLALAAQFADQIAWLDKGRLVAVTECEPEAISVLAGKLLGRHPSWSVPVDQDRAVPYFERG